MAEEGEKPYIEISCDSPWFDASNTQCYRPEIVVGTHRFLPHSKDYSYNGRMTKEKASEIAREVASTLGIELKLKVKIEGE